MIEEASRPHILKKLSEILLFAPAWRGTYGRVLAGHSYQGVYLFFHLILCDAHFFQAQGFSDFYAGFRISSAGFPE